MYLYELQELFRFSKTKVAIISVLPLGNRFYVEFLDSFHSLKL